MADLSDILGVLKKIAPWITAAATGNVPGLVTMAAQAVTGVVGKEVKPDVDSITAAIAGATPEQLQAMKQADNEFALKVQALGFQHEEEMYKTEVEDRVSARDREKALRDKTPQILAYIIIGSTVVMEGIFAYLVFTGHTFTPDGAIVIGRIMGTMDGMALTAVAYFLGSSLSSAKKDEIRHAEAVNAVK